MISVNRRKDTKKAKTTGNSVEGPSEAIEGSQNPFSKRNRSKTLSNKKQPLPNPEAFILTEKKRIKHDEDDQDQLNSISPTFHHIIPNTPMKRSQSDEERTQQERYKAELSYRYTSQIAITQTKNSTLYRVTDSQDQVYALKELNPIFLSKKKSLQRSALLEYQHAKLLAHHPNIVRYDSYIQFGPYISFQMEYLLSGTLEDYLKKESLHDPVTGFEKDLLWYFLFDLLNALSYMHSRKIVHMDLKPSNILMAIRTGTDNMPMLKIGDFGLSKIIGSEKESFKKGDGKYLAPELLEPGSIITTAVDIFSLGICIYEMATDFTASDILWQNIINNHIVYDKISHDLKPLIAQMLSKDPSLRISASHCLLIHDRLHSLWKDSDHLLDPMIIQSDSQAEPLLKLPDFNFLISEEEEMFMKEEMLEGKPEAPETKVPIVSIRKKLF